MDKTIQFQIITFKRYSPHLGKEFCLHLEVLALDGTEGQVLG